MAKILSTILSIFLIIWLFFNQSFWISYDYLTPQVIKNLDKRIDSIKWYKNTYIDNIISKIDQKLTQSISKQNFIILSELKDYLTNKKEIANSQDSVFNNVLSLNENNDLSCNSEKISIDKNNYWEVEDIIFSDDWREKIVYTKKWKWESCNCEWGEKFIWVYYYFYYKDDVLIESRSSWNNFSLWFADWKYKYIISYHNKIYSLDFKNKHYSIKWIIYYSFNNFLFSWKKERILFLDWTFSKEYDQIFNYGKLDNWDNILIIWKGKKATWMWENFDWDYYIVNNWIDEEIKIWNWWYIDKLVTCDNNYWYIYSNNNNEFTFNFWWKKYWENKKTRGVNFYWFKDNTCIPMYVQILDNWKWDFWINKLFLWDKLIAENNWNIRNPKINWSDYFYEIYEKDDTYWNWYKLYKNDKKIENRWWLQQYWFLKNGELLYSTVYNWYAIIKKWASEESIPWIGWVDNLYISGDWENYAFKVRWNSTKLYYNWKIIENENDLIDAVFVKNTLFSTYSNFGWSKNYFYKNNSLINEFSWNPNIVIPNEKKEFNTYTFTLNVDWVTNLINCK